MREKIETSRLLLRPFELGDAESLYRNLHSDPLTRSWSDDDKATLDHTKQWIEERRVYYERKHFYDWAVVWKNTGEVIGEINAAYLVEYAMADVGYSISSRMWGQGICTEALRAVIAYLFSCDCRVVVGACRRKNAASARVMEKAGMHLVKELPASFEQMDGTIDMLYYEISNPSKESY